MVRNTCNVGLFTGEPRRRKVWEDYVRASFMAVSAEGEVNGMLKAINKKIEKHTGGSGLPK